MLLNPKNLQSYAYTLLQIQIKTTSPEKYRVRPSASYIKVGGVCEVEIHVHQSQLSDDTSGDISSSNSNYISTEVSASLMKDKFLVTAITLEEDSEEHLPQSKLNELLKVKQLSKIFLKILGSFRRNAQQKKYSLKLEVH